MYAPYVGIVFVFSIPFFILPFVFERYTFDGEYLKVKNMLGITTKKVSISDFEDVYERSVGSSALFYMVDKKERMIIIREYYCPNIHAFITILAKGKTYRDDRVQLHDLKKELTVTIGYTAALLIISLFFTGACIRIYINETTGWIVYLFTVFFIALTIRMSYYIIKDYKLYKQLKLRVRQKTDYLRKRIEVKRT